MCNYRYYRAEVSFYSSINKMCYICNFSYLIHFAPGTFMNMPTRALVVFYVYSPGTVPSVFAIWLMPLASQYLLLVLYNVQA